MLTQKSRIALMMAVILVLCFGLVCVNGAVIATDSAAKAVIIISKDANEPERHAADELANFLGQVTGAKFEIVNEAVSTADNIFVGPEAAKKADPNFSTDGLGTDGIIIKTVGNNLILAGGKPRGTLYAVYTFLEDYVGCHWWSPGASTIPSKPTLVVEKIDIRYVPKLNYRDTWLPTALDPDWSVRNKRIGQSPARHLRAAAPLRGGYIEIWPTFHSFFIALPPEKYFKEHSEWYSLINGKRTAEPSTHASLCLTNKAMRQQFAANFTAEVIADSKNVSEYVSPVVFASIGYPDDDGYPIRCQCADCVAAETAGNPSDVLMEFTNFVAEEFEKTCPNIPVAFGAYHHVQPPPKHVKPRHNVMARVCNISNSFSVPAYDDRNKDFREDFIGWTKISPQLQIYTYVVNFTYEMLPHPNLRAFGPDIRYYVDNGVSGIFAEGWGSGTGGYEMAELRAWLLAKLMWNPYQSDEALIKEFTDGYYGAAGEHILAYLNVMHDAVRASGDWLGLSSPPNAKFLSFTTLNKGWAYLKAAEQAVQNDKELLMRVKVAQLPVLYTFMVRWQEFRETATCRGIEWPISGSIRDIYNGFMEVVDKNNIGLSSTTQADLGKALENKPATVPSQAIPKAVDLRGDPELTIFRSLWQSYDPVADLPIEAKFATDPSEKGENEKWHALTFDDSQWKTIKVDEFWENQGYPDFDGTGWYRIRFTVPEKIPADKKLYLSFGRLDQAGKIWLNGEYVAEYSGSWEARFEIDITQYLKKGSENLLTVKVFGGDGVGGLWAPIKLITQK